jgi:hypothetical protein
MLYYSRSTNGCIGFYMYDEDLNPAGPCGIRLAMGELLSSPMVWLIDLS